jgi:hypothetical protein
MSTTYNIPPGLTLRAGGDSVSCDDCGVWEYLHRGLRHSRRCDTPRLQVTPVAAPAPVAAPTPGRSTVTRAELRAAVRDGRLSAVASEAEIDQMVGAGVLSVSAAMNRDF